MATASAFSYAQAAKGQGPAPTNTPADQDSQTQSSESTTKPSANGHPGADAGEAPSQTAAPQASEQSEQTNAPVEVSAASETIRTSSQAETRRDEELSRLDRPWRRTDKGPTRSSSTTTRSVDDSDSKRQRKGRKSKTSDKTAGDETADKKAEAEPEPKIELSEAPIPSVNIWQQRKETLLSKKVVPSSVNDVKLNGVAAHGNKADGQKKQTTDAPEAASVREAPLANGVKASKKTSEHARPDRNASRGSRVAEKNTKSEIPPPVADAVAWPTPETAIKDVKKPAETSEKSDKETQDDGSHKPRQKEKWVTMDYVPSVTFETQISRPSGGKPRGGSRNVAGTRAAQSGNASAEKSGAQGNGSVNKNSDAKERTREPANGAPRTSSNPPVSKRASVDLTASSRDHRKPTVQAGSEKKDTAASQQTVGVPAAISTTQRHMRSKLTRLQEAPAPRETRNERGRGGYRGRGGHHSMNGHGPSHNGNVMGGPNFVPNGANSRGQPYSPPPRQGPHGQAFAPPSSQRGGRGGRNAANHYNRMSLPNNASRLPPVQTNFAPYEYPMAPMTAMPFQQPPFWDSMVMSMLKQQIEYYFSIDNLCKDMFLRQRMDSQGFVPLHFILAFQRVKDMQAEIGMVRAICEESTEVDYVIGEDDCERLRRRQGWETFVLPMKDRDVGAQNHGPTQLSFKNRSYNMGPHYNGMSSPPMGYPMGAHHAFSAPPEQSFQPFGHGTATSSGAQDHGNGKRGASNGTTQLSANVPDFSPSGSFPSDGQASSAPNGVSEGTNGPGNSVNGHADGLTNGLTNGVHAAASDVEPEQA